MSDADKALENYIKKLMEMQYNPQTDPNFSDKDLKEIALEVGLTEEAWHSAQQKAQNHLHRGKAYLSTNNWEDATPELEQAAMLMPNSAEANYLAAKAFLHRGNMLNQVQDYDKAEYYLNRSLSSSPTYSEALTLKQELNNRRRIHSNETTQRSKSKNMIKWGVIGGIALLLIVGYFSMYNSMVEAEENTEQAWAQVENVYQRRADLVPNLIETVKGAANFERETLNEVIQARAAATSVQIDPTELDEASLQEYAERQGELSASLNRLLAVSESYPSLTATENFRDLQAQLEGTENRIAVERKRFNDAVQAYNSKARRFPYNLLGFDTKAYFSTAPQNQEAPNVEF